MSNLRRDIFLGMLPLLLGIELLASIVFVPIALKGNADFRQFYNGGYMLRNGYRHQLYDFDLQAKISGSALPAVHPAYEYLLFLPLSFLPYRTAYFAWLLINCEILYFSLRLLRPRFDGSPWLLAAIGIAFVPIWVTLVQGQDSLLMLALLLLADDCGPEFCSGLWLGLGAFKFHIVLPIALLYLLWRKWRIFAGFCLSGTLAAMLSVAIIGIPESIHYVKTASASAATQLHPGAMPNLNGLIVAILGRGRAATVLAVITAIVVIFWASQQKPSMATAARVVPLISFYFMGHDLSILLLPIVESALCAPWLGAVLILVPGYAYLAAIPLLGIFAFDKPISEGAEKSTRSVSTA